MFWIRRRHRSVCIYVIGLYLYRSGKLMIVLDIVHSLLCLFQVKHGYNLHELEDMRQTILTTESCYSQN